jgi:hypothetical protein
MLYFTLSLSLSSSFSPRRVYHTILYSYTHVYIHCYTPRVAICHCGRDLQYIPRACRARFFFFFMIFQDLPEDCTHEEVDPNEVAREFIIHLICVYMYTQYVWNVCVILCVSCDAVSSPFRNKRVLRFMYKKTAPGKSSDETLSCRCCTHIKVAGFTTPRSHLLIMLLYILCRWISGFDGLEIIFNKKKKKKKS